MAITTTLQKVEALYIGYFGRAGDPDGTTYWINKLNSGFSLSDAAASFSVQPEAKAAYAYLKNPTLVSPTDFVTQVYQNLFNRAPDDAGKAYWVAELTANQGNPAYVGNFILSVINGAYGAGGSATDVATIENKVAAGSYFTELAAAKNLDLTTTVDGTVVLTAEAKLGAAAAVGSAVTSDAATVTDSKAVSDGFMPQKLTVGVDTLVGTSSNDTFDASETAAKAPTLNAGDSIDGGAGIDTLKMVHSGSITAVTGLNIKNIEIANLTSTTDGVAMDTTTWAGLTNLNSTSVFTADLTAAATTDVKATVGDVSGANAGVSVTGGKDVTVNASGTVAAVSDPSAEIVVSGAAGKVVVNNHFAGADAAVQADVSVTGGTTITVTETLGNAVNSTNTHGNVSVTGGATTTAVTVNQDKAATASATVAGKVNSAVTISDANAASATAAGTITSATVSNFTTLSINNNALTNLSVTGGSGNIIIDNSGLTTATNKTLGLTVNGQTAGTLDDADIYTTLNVTGAGNASTLANVTFGATTALNVDGSAAVTLTSVAGLTALTAVTSTNTAGLKLGSAIGTGVSFTGGTGADSIILSNGFTKAINMGAGDDTVTYGGAAGTGGSVNAGDGFDTIIMSGANAQAASATGVFNSKFSGFEALTILGGGAANVNLAGINGVQTVNTSGQSGILALSGLASGGIINLTAAPSGGSGDVQAIVTNAALSANDVVNLKLTNSESATVHFGKFTAADVETINISTVDAGTGVNVAASVDTATLVASSATKIVVSGNNGLNLTNTGNTAVTSFDASGVVGNDATDTAANLAVTFASENTDAAAVVTITGGAGNDVLTGNAGKDTIIGGAGNDTISGGAGNDTISGGVGNDTLNGDAGDDIIDGGDGDDTITGGTGIDTLTGGAGSDTFVIAAGDAGITGTEKITDFSIALGGDKLDLSTTTLVANKTADITGVIGGTVDLSATVKDGIITVSGADAGVVNTLGQFKLIFEFLENDAVADVAAFALNGQTYVITDAIGVAANDIIQLAGVSGATSMSTTDAANSIWIA